MTTRLGPSRCARFSPRAYRERSAWAEMSRRSLALSAAGRPGRGECQWVGVALSKTPDRPAQFKSGVTRLAVPIGESVANRFGGALEKACQGLQSDRDPLYQFAELVSELEWKPDGRSNRKEDDEFHRRRKLAVPLAVGIKQIGDKSSDRLGNLKVGRERRHITRFDGFIPPSRPVDRVSKPAGMPHSSKINPVREDSPANGGAAQQVNRIALQNRSGK